MKTMPPKVNEKYLNLRRDEILEAAFYCFTEKGFSNTTMQDIFKRAGLSAGAIYKYFKSKEDIIAAASAKSLARNKQMIAAAVNAGGDNPLIDIVHIFFPLIKDEASLKVIGFDLGLYAEATRNPQIAQILKDSNDALLESLVDVVKKMQAAGKYNSQLHPKALAQFLIGLYYGLIVNKVMDPDIEIDAAMELCEIVLNSRLDNV
jgi:TetR/AcrR family transcriptional regulator, transcriptional repressor of aconitase